MRIFKKTSALLVVVVILFFAISSVSYGAAGLDDTWAVNEDASGTRGKGPLVMFALQVLPGIEVFGEGGVDPTYLMHFFLRVKYQGVFLVFTGVASSVISHPTDLGDAETHALHEFLKKVTVSLKSGWEGCTPDPFGDADPSPEFVCPNILKSITNSVDTDPPSDSNDLLAIIMTVKLRIPDPPAPE